ncbi:hypothetical protein [Streptomyces sp. NPDC001594]|uniref:hypothetical protein n=1 Tax=Streptomyces sp. NPDC001594 TaxID=3364590 RepID=UPI0036AFC3B7
MLAARDMLPAAPATVCACGAPGAGDKALFGFLVVNRDGAAGVDAVERAAYRHLIGPMTPCH